MKAVRLIGL